VAVRKQAVEWAQKFAPPMGADVPPSTTAAPARIETPDRPLRIGYVSADFKLHAVALFLLPIVQHHDRRRVNVTCYSNVQIHDDMTRRFMTLADQWRDIRPLSAGQAANLIRSDRIDVLIDVAGHTFAHQLAIFSQRPAAVQATYLGYPGTTGVSAIDWRITDALADPPGMSESHFTERLMRLEGCAWWYVPMPQMPPVAARSGPGVVFATCATFAKITPRILQLWGTILNAVPGARLLIKSAGAAAPSSRDRLARTFAAMGVDPGRLDIRPYTPHTVDHLSMYPQADIVLDTFPYNGTTTTCEALWMGLPVVTLAGSAHVSRVGVSLLTCTGLSELIAATPADYVRIATALAANGPLRQQLRSTLRQRLLASPLMNGQLIGQLESAYRQMFALGAAKRE
jgi:predicted O-linked N-acetylglucosamine transferase (SPINDLY family)